MKGILCWSKLTKQMWSKSFTLAIVKAISIWSKNYEVETHRWSHQTWCLDFLYRILIKHNHAENISANIIATCDYMFVLECQDSLRISNISHQLCFDFSPVTERLEIIALNKSLILPWFILLFKWTWDVFCNMFGGKNEVVTAEILFIGVVL